MPRLPVTRGKTAVAFKLRHHQGTPSWPFASIPVGRFTALPEPQREKVERALLKAINECEMVPMSEADQRHVDQVTKRSRQTRGTVKKAA